MRLPCAICGAPIDYSLPARHPLSFEVDEIVPVSLGGSELEWSNLQPAHRICNERKGNRMCFTCEPPCGPAPSAVTRFGADAPQASGGVLGGLSQDWRS